MLVPFAAYFQTNKKEKIDNIRPNVSVLTTMVARPCSISTVEAAVTMVHTVVVQLYRATIMTHDGWISSKCSRIKDDNY